MPLLDLNTLGLLVDEQPVLNPDRGMYWINGASVIVADIAGHPDWLGLDVDGANILPVAAPRRAAMIAEQLAKRAYENPNAVVAEGSLGPIGGDRMVEEYAKTLEPTEWERAYLEEIRAISGLTPTAPGGSLWVLQMEVRPSLRSGDTVYYNDLDPRAKPWPVTVVGQDFGASGGPVP